MSVGELANECIIEIAKFIYILIIGLPQKHLIEQKCHITFAFCVVGWNRTDKPQDGDLPGKQLVGLLKAYSFETRYEINKYVNISLSFDVKAIESVNKKAKLYYCHVCFLVKQASEMLEYELYSVLLILLILRL